MTVVVLAAIAFSGLALALAGRLRAEATLALANVIYVLLLAGGALVLPLDRYPGALADRRRVAAHRRAGRGAAGVHGRLVPLWPVLSLLVWCGLGLLAAWKGFRWTS